MSITVNEAMQLSVMKNTNLVAGLSGVHNSIKWVTIVEVIEDINRLQEGEFLITTGYGLNENKNHFLELLSMKKLAGVAIYTGFYLSQIPESFIEAANSNELPLIEIPTDINFSTITKGILQEILNRQLDIVSSSLHFHKELTSLVLKAEGENNISKTLAYLINTSIFIINEFGECSHSVSQELALKKKDHQFLYEDQVLFNFRELTDKCKENHNPIEFEKENFKIICYPIVANKLFYGAILSVKRIAAWKEIDLSVIEHAATVYAIEYLKNDAVEQTQIKLRGEFLEEIINKNFKNTTLALEHGKKLGFDFNLQQAVLHLKLHQENYDGNQLKNEILHLYKQVNRILKQTNQPFIIRERLDALTILYQVTTAKKQSPKEQCHLIATNILTKWKEQKEPTKLVIGIGKVYHHVNKLSESAIEAKYAVDLADLLLTKKEIIYFDDLGTFHLLLQMKEAGIDLKAFYEEHLGDLIKQSQQGIDLIHTLEIYFKNNLNIQTTAKDLFIHRHTLKYRLNQVEKKSTYQLDSADDRLKLQLAISAYKLEHHINKYG